MRLTSFLCFSFAVSATAAAADTSYSDMLATDGLAKTAATLGSLPAPTPSDQFALGGVRFLSVVENALQTRYTYGMTGGLTDILDVPLLRLPIFDNPTPDTFTPAVVNAIFADALDDLAPALVALDTITDGDNVAVTINTDDIWFDINMNAVRDRGEGFFEVLGDDLDRSLDDKTPNMTIRFDTADAAWLSAYAHVLSGVSEAILAVDPATALAATLESGAIMDDMRGTPFQDNTFFLPPEGPVYLDILAGALLAFEGQPDVTRSRAAHAHLRGMIADNKTFWSRVAAETDNNAEWIPNKNQQSALPFEFPPQTGQMWRQVLADAEALLNGDLLIPHWRLGDDVGLNLARLMQDPPELDVIGILQGRTIASFVERGPLIDGGNLRAFDQMVGGNAPFFIVLLN